MSSFTVLLHTYHSPLPPSRMTGSSEVDPLLDEEFQYAPLCACPCHVSTTSGRTYCAATFSNESLISSCDHCYLCLPNPGDDVPNDAGPADVDQDQYHYFENYAGHDDGAVGASSAFDCEQEDLEELAFSVMDVVIQSPRAEEIQVMDGTQLERASPTQSQQTPPFTETTVFQQSIKASDLPREACYCPECNLEFTGKYAKGNMHRHKRLKHGMRCVRCYPCSDCTKVYKRSDALLKHTRKEHAVRNQCTLASMTIGSAGPPSIETSSAA